MKDYVVNVINICIYTLNKITTVSKGAFFDIVYPILAATLYIRYGMNDYLLNPISQSLKPDLL